MENFLVFDVSSQTNLYCGEIDGDRFFFCKEYQKGEMNRKLPDVITDIKNKLSGRKDVTVIVGTGPGSFTGLKTGLSMFIGMLYSIGIIKIRTISSLKLFFILSQKKSDYTLSISPFNRDELFFSLFDRSGKTTINDEHDKGPYDKISQAIEITADKTIDILSLQNISEDVEKVLRNIFKNAQFDKLSFPENFDPEGTEALDISKEPLLLNYVAYPANIKESQNIYVNNIERNDMKVENLSINDINDKLKKLREEHKRFDEMSDSLAQKNYLTPSDEMELNTLRKKKLLKKDMISYYENILDKQIT